MQQDYISRSDYNKLKRAGILVRYAMRDTKEQSWQKCLHGKCAYVAFNEQNTFFKTKKCVARKL